MRSFREIAESDNRIYRNEDGKNWSIADTSISKKIRQVGYKQIGIGLLKTFEKKGQDSEYVFVDLLSNEKDKAKEVELKPGERLVRYMSRTTLISDMVILCILNADKGYMKYMENIEDDPDLADAKWSRPQKFAYLRVKY
jgi:hypothetical protein